MSGSAVLLRASAVLLLTLVPDLAFAAATNPSGLPLPRFVTVRAKESTVRVGPGYQYNVAWTYQTPLSIDTGMAADKHEVTYAYPVWTGNLWSELIRMDHVRLVFLARLSNLSEGRIDSESRGGQGCN